MMPFQTLADVVREQYGQPAIYRIQELAFEYFEIAERDGLVAFLYQMKTANPSDFHMFAMAIVLTGLSTHQWEKIKDSLDRLPAKGLADWKRGL